MKNHKPRKERKVYGDSEQNLLIRAVLKAVKGQGKEIKDLKKEIKKMAKTEQDAIAKLDELVTAAQAQKDETVKLIAAVKDLIARVGQGGTPTDFQPFIDKVQTVIDNLAEDNTAVQDALDAATPPTP